MTIWQENLENIRQTFRLKNLARSADLYHVIMRLIYFAVGAAFGYYLAAAEVAGIL